MGQKGAFGCAFFCCIREQIEGGLRKSYKDGTPKNEAFRIEEETSARGIAMLSLRDIIDFAAMSEDLADELNSLKIGLPDLGAAVVGQGDGGSNSVRGCEATPCAANKCDGK
jgi:hypothetical protein